MAEDALEREVESEPAEDAATEMAVDDTTPETPAEEPAPAEMPDLASIVPEVIVPAAVAEPETVATPETVAEEPAPETPVAQEPEPRPRSPLPWWPYLVLGIAWLALWGAQTYVLTRTPDVPVVSNEAYPLFLLIGMFLVLFGPLSSLIVWLAVRDRATTEQLHGLYTRSLFRSSVMTLIGAGGWVVSIVAVDALRLGLIRI